MKWTITKAIAWLVGALLVVPFVIALIEAMPYATRHAAAGESWIGALLFAATLQTVWLVPKISVVLLPTIGVYLLVALLSPRVDRWLTLLIVLPAAASALTWLLWVFTDMHWLDDSNQPYVYVSLSAVLPRLAAKSMWPGRLLSSSHPTAE